MKNKIYITADPHREFDYIMEFCCLNDTTYEDIMIVLGDAGLNYYLDYDDDKLKSRLREVPITLFLIQGNHEERPEFVPGYREKTWHDGTVRYEAAYPNLLFAKDGEIYDFNSKKAVVIGGAFSVDKYYRIRSGNPWFCMEQPSELTKAYVEQQLKNVGWKVDYVLSHTAPLKYEPTEKFLPFIDQRSVDKTTEEWLDTIEDRLDYEHWYLGHYHCDKQIDKVRIVYRDIFELE